MVRRWLRQPADRLHPLADGTLAAARAEAWLRQSCLPWRWLADDEAVAQHRASIRPALTLTITSRILFSERSLNAASGDWFNVHPGLLPRYAGASPGPYMFLDGVGGCTIHRMAVRVDAGSVIDHAPLAQPLGDDGAHYFFEQLPVHTAGRIACLLGHWRTGEPWPVLAPPDPSALRHCSSKRLAHDRRLDWRLAPARVARWVVALARIAPAWLVNAKGGRVDVMAAAVRPSSGAADIGVPGTVLSVDGRWVDIACSGGVVALRCRGLPGMVVGQRLPLPAGGETP